MESSQSHHQKIQNQTISIDDVQSSVDNLLQRWKRRQRWQNFLHRSWQSRLEEHAKKRAPCRIHLAKFLESTPLHVLTIFLLLVDLAFTIYDLSSSLISCRSKNERETTVSRVFHYVGIAILTFLLAKVLGLVVALGGAFFARPGRVVDAIVVVVALVLELMLKKVGAGLIVVVSLWRVVRVVESAFEVSDEAIEAKIEEIVSQFEVLRSENQILRESIVEKDKLILELEAALDQGGV
ncbi:hypothetical protein Sjap_005958 [Stephania japonica]|uniref:Voltage-gated hydrogen channel 1 n=1 Tax=Stephania japonica TaxID=461633 RepID=A0AAP0K7H4_9MAGN